VPAGKGGYLDGEAQQEEEEILGLGKPDNPI
jgi:hypothetical protein